MRRLGLAVVAMAAVSLVFASVSSAAVNICVPSTAGQPVTSGGSSGTCSGGDSAVAMPSSSC